MITINVKHIQAMAGKRPEGYVEEVLALGEVKNGVLHVSDRKGYARLVKKYAALEPFHGRRFTAEEAERIRTENVMETAGPPLWADLHAAAKAGLLTPVWLTEFAARIPCGICRTHWRELLKSHPPRYDDQYVWSVEVHNVVNVQLGRAVWPRSHKS